MGGAPTIYTLSKGGWGIRGHQPCIYTLPHGTTKAGGTHPTGMLSCLIFIHFLAKNDK